MAGPAVRVEGLRDLSRHLRAIDKSLARDLRIANKAAAETVLAEARRRASSLGGVAAKTAPTLRASGEQQRATVRLGGARAPYALGAEFGAKRYRQFKPWRGNQWGGFSGGPGYFLHPAIRETADEIVGQYGNLLDKLTAKAFPGA